MHLLDTDTLTHLHAGHPRVAQRLKECADSEVRTTIVTRIELIRGRFEFLLKAQSGRELLRAQELLVRTEVLLSQLRVVALNDISIEVFDQLRRTKGLKKIGRADLLIASIAISHGAILVTRNRRHFDAVPGLTTVNWVDG